MPHDIVLLTVIMLTVLNGAGIALSYVLVWRGPGPESIQKRSYAIATLNKRMGLIALNLAIIYSLTVLTLSWVETWLTWHKPQALVLLAEIFFISLVDDTWFYFLHRYMHTNRRLYKTIHLTHHRAHTPVPIEYIYVHPVEWLAGMAGPITGLLVVGFIDGGLNAWVFLGYSTLRTLHELTIHSGLRSTVGRLIPFYGTAEHHDLHHAQPHAGNFGASYTLWDRLLGTQASPTAPKR